MGAVAGMQTGGPQPEELPKNEPKAKGPKIVDLEEQQQADAAKTEGHSFFFGDIGVIKFPDGTSYHVKANRALITDPKVVENLLEAAKNPFLKIFLD